MTIWRVWCPGLGGTKKNSLALSAHSAEMAAIKWAECGYQNSALRQSTFEVLVVEGLEGLERRFRVLDDSHPK